MTKLFFSLLLVLLLGGAFAAHAGNVHVIVCGSGGEPAYTAKFRDWGERLRAALVEKARCAPGSVFLLTEPAKSTQPPSGPGFAKIKEHGTPRIRPPAHASTLENIRETFRGLAESGAEIQDLYIYLIGHGSYRRGVSKINIPGPDLDAEELGTLVDAVSAERCVIVNAASASAGFINALSGKNRIICAATKSTEERNATEFMQFFLQGFEDGSADRDRDERISLLELCTQASVLTAAWYTSEGLIATEHALLDDNGDGLGTRLPIETAAGGAADGDAARTCYVKDYVFPPSVSGELIAEYKNALGAVEALTGKKAEMEETAYYAELERLLVKAARANRAIRKAAEG